MKNKEILLIIIGSIVLSFCGCGAGSTTAKSDENTLCLGEWGESQPLDFAEKDGAVYIVDQNGEKVLDVTDYLRTDIISDEISGETRLIKTWTAAGTEEIVIDNDMPTEMQVFTYDYYDAQGQPLLEASEHSIDSVVDEFALTEVLGSVGSVFQLATGKCLGKEGSYYFSDTVSLKTQTESASTTNREKS